MKWIVGRPGLHLSGLQGYLPPLGPFDPGAEDETEEDPRPEPPDMCPEGGPPFPRLRHDPAQDLQRDPIAEHHPRREADGGEIESEEEEVVDPGAGIEHDVRAED